ncbi:hypothetical protein BH09MYX1_BH09MYX1_50380 [soil metagenome]
MPERSPEISPIARRHLRAGYWALAIYLGLGIVLESLHAVKSGYYLDVGNETRRLLFRLAHAHGTLFALVNVVYGLTVRAIPETARPLASAGLLGGLVLVPLGFFLGGLVVHGGDPGLGIVLAPAGAVAMAVGVIVVARSLR